MKKHRNQDGDGLYLESGFYSHHGIHHAIGKPTSYGASKQLLTHKILMDGVSDSTHLSRKFQILQLRLSTSRSEVEEMARSVDGSFLASK